MSATTIATGDGLAVKRWADQAFREYVDKLVLKPYMGMDSESVIQVKEDLMKEQGDAITFAFARALDGAGVTGESTLEGAEDVQDFYSHQVVVQQYRQAVLLGGSLTKRRAAFDIHEENKAALTTWLAQQVEAKIFERLSSIGGVAYGSASETQKDQWSDYNEDRILYGAATANLDGSGGLGTGGNDHSDSLLTIDATADKLTTAQISLAKRLAILANPKVRPIRIENGEEYYVMFIHPYCARDLKASTAWQDANREAMMRGQNNPIFTGALGMWDGVIIKETPKILLLPDVGDSSTVDVAMNLLCGAQAVGFAQGGYEGNQRIVMTGKLFDYDEKIGTAIKTTYGAEKLTFNNKQNGVVTVFSAAQPD